MDSILDGEVYDLFIHKTVDGKNIRFTINTFEGCSSGVHKCIKNMLFYWRASNVQVKKY